MSADQLSAKASAIKGEGLDAKAVRNRATIAGAGIGAMFGMYYGFSKKKNILAMAGVGALIGAICSRLLVPKE